MRRYYVVAYLALFVLAAGLLLVAGTRDGGGLTDHTSTASPHVTIAPGVIAEYRRSLR